MDCLGRFGAWLAVLALAFQVLLPAVPARAAIIERDLAASICHSTSESDVPASAKLSHDHCQFCQLHAGIKLLAPPAVAGLAVPRAVSFAAVPAADDGGVAPSVHLPQSQRGPPLHS